MSITDSTPGSNDPSAKSTPMETLAAARSHVQKLAGGFSTGQRFGMAVVFFGVIGGILAFSFLSRQTDWAPLMSSLDPTDAAAITKQLDAKGTPFELADGGTTIMVPKDVVYQTRIDVADVAMPSSGKVGYGILDNQSLTTSEFGQRVGFQRAMEGELAKTIEAIDGVQAATVHLAMPKSATFVLDDQKASASVMVKTAKGMTLSSHQVQAVVNLVAGGIEGLAPGDVTVADSEGHVLAAPGINPGSASGGGSNSDALSSYESGVSQAIESMLAAAVGPGKAKATVSADLDFSNTTSTKETYEAPTTLVPGEALATNETTKTEAYGGTGAGGTTGGVLGTTGTPTTVAGAAASTSGTGYQLNEKQVTNALNKVTEQTSQSPGEVKRLSVAVMVDEKALSADKISEIKALVSAAAGIDPARGDTIAISRLKFDDTVQQQMSAELNARKAAADGLPVWVFGAAGLAVLVIVGLAFMLMRKGKKKGETFAALELPAGSGPGTGVDLSDRSVTITATPRQSVIDPITGGVIAASEDLTRIGAGSGGPGLALANSGPGDERREILGQLIDNQPDEVAQLLRSWLGDRREVSR